MKRIRALVLDSNDIFPTPKWVESEFDCGKKCFDLDQEVRAEKIIMSKFPSISQINKLLIIDDEITNNDYFAYKLIGENNNSMSYIQNNNFSGYEEICKAIGVKIFSETKKAFHEKQIELFNEEKEYIGIFKIRMIIHPEFEVRELVM